MAKRILFILSLLACLPAPAAAVEEIMAMHPGAPYNEVGIGVAVAPIRRVTSEDPRPERREARQPLRKNMVTLKIPVAPPPAERRLRMVEARIDSRDGALDFDVEGAPLFNQSMEIPGLVAPEYLAMDKFNLADAEAPGRQRTNESRQSFRRELEMAPAPAAPVRIPETGKSRAQAKAVVTYPEPLPTAKARALDPLPKQAPEKRPAPLPAVVLPPPERKGETGALDQLRIPDLPSETTATMAPHELSAPPLPTASPAGEPAFAAPAVASSLRPPSASSGSGRSSLAPPPTGSGMSLKPPATGVPSGTGLSIAQESLSSVQSPSSFAPTGMFMGPISLTTPAPAPVPSSQQPERWTPQFGGGQSLTVDQGLGRKKETTIELPEPDEQGFIPMRQVRSILKPAAKNGRQSR